MPKLFSYISHCYGNETAHPYPDRKANNDAPKKPIDAIGFIKISSPYLA